MVITEIKTVKVDSNCYDNPVYLSWLNVYGGREYWLFGNVQDKGLSTSVNETFEPIIDDITNARGYFEETSRNSTPNMTLYANLDIEDIEGVKTLLYSANVEMLVNENPIKWQNVRLQIGSFKLYATNQTTATISFTIELPKVNIQGQ